jgi:hypothetical protein
MSSAPGDGNLTYKVIQQFLTSLPSCLPDLFTALFKFGAFPKEWKHGNCVVVRKVGKENYNLPNSYRPISLLPCMGRVFEKIVAQRIAISGLHSGAVCNTQMGGQAQNSAIDALLRILDRIGRDISKRINYSKKKPLRPVVLTHDIEGAFNNAHPKLLTQIMSQRQMPQYLIQ